MIRHFNHFSCSTLTVVCSKLLLKYNISKNHKCHYYNSSYKPIGNIAEIGSIIPIKNKTKLHEFNYEKSSCKPIGNIAEIGSIIPFKNKSNPKNPFFKINNNKKFNPINTCYLKRGHLYEDNIKTSRPMLNNISDKETKLKHAEEFMHNLLMISAGCGFFSGLLFSITCGGIGGAVVITTVTTFLGLASGNIIALLCIPFLR